ncbi:MAG: acyltransferase family protein [Clostridia bacterium]|nr:acyltransferase family protein [Clostridia bacterium]
MIIFLIILAGFCIYGIRFHAKIGFDDYMSPQKTGAIKGIFVFIVFLSHLRQYIILSSAFYDQIFSYCMALFNQLIVVVFLFYSGYGVYLGICNKDDYVKTIPTKRALKVWLHFDIALILFYITGLCIGKDYSVKQLLLSFVGVKSIGNSVWFVFTIIILYLLTYFVFLIAKKHTLIGTAVLTVVTFAAVLVLIKLKGEESWWYNTMMCYPLGMWYAIAKPKIDKHLLPSFKKWLLCTALIGAVFVAMRLLYQLYDTQIIFIPMALVFAILVVLLSMRFSINNAVLRWFGKHVFGIYILQRIPMIVFSYFGLNEYPIVFSFLSLTVTLILAEVFDRLMDQLDIILHLSKKPVKKVSAK